MLSEKSDKVTPLKTLACEYYNFYTGKLLTIFTLEILYDFHTGNSLRFSLWETPYNFNAGKLLTIFTLGNSFKND